MRAIRTAVVLLVVVATLAVGVYYWVRPSLTNSNATTVTVAQVGDFFIYLPIYIAQDKGFFAQNGLNVRIINTGGDEKSVAAVISGDADFGVGDPTFAPMAALQGQDVRVVASIVNGVPFWGVTKNPKVPTISDPKQLAGFTVATFPSPSTAYTLQTEMFKRGGLPPNIHQAQFGTLLPLLDSGAADIVLELEPNVSTAVSEGARVVYSMASMYGDFAITGVTVSEKTIETRPDVVKRFVRAINEAEQYGHTNPADTAYIAKSRFPTIAPAIVDAALKRMLESDTYPASASISETAWRKALQLRVDAGQLPSVDGSQHYLDDSFARAGNVN